MDTDDIIEIIIYNKLFGGGSGGGSGSLDCEITTTVTVTEVTS